MFHCTSATSHVDKPGKKRGVSNGEARSTMKRPCLSSLAAFEAEARLVRTFLAPRQMSRLEGESDIEPTGSSSVMERLSSKVSLVSSREEGNRMPCSESLPGPVEA